MASPITPRIALAAPKKIPPYKAGIVSKPVSMAPKIGSGIMGLAFAVKSKGVYVSHVVDTTCLKQL